jgi:hypothetical protein
MLCSKPSAFASSSDFLANRRNGSGRTWTPPLESAHHARIERFPGWLLARDDISIEIRCGSVSFAFRVPTTLKSNKMQTMPKRSYTRRTPEDRLRELEAKLAEAKAKLEADKERDSPLHRDWQKTNKLLRKFIQTASDAGRGDIAISVQAFSAGIERSLRMSADEDNPRRRGRTSTFEDAS